jgi:hypothetical protein
LPSRRISFGGRPRPEQFFASSGFVPGAHTVARHLAGITGIKKGLEIAPVSRMDEVLARAMTRKPEPIEWDT